MTFYAENSLTKPVFQRHLNSPLMFNVRSLTNYILILYKIAARMPSGIEPLTNQTGPTPTKQQE